jgi:HEAT repeat protein
MKSTLSIFIVTLLLLGLSLNEIYSQGTSAEQQPKWGQSPDKALDSLVSTTNRDDRFWATWSLHRNREDMVGKLIKILNGSYSDNVKMDAVVVLGDYRASEAIPFLVQYLEWDDFPHEKVSKAVIFARIPDKVIDALNTPVSAALGKIGMPAIPALLDKIIQTDDIKITEKCVSICQTIEGKEVTQFRLQGLLDKETDQKKKERIQSAMEALKNLNVEK